MEQPQKVFVRSRKVPLYTRVVLSNPHLQNAAHPLTNGAIRDLTSPTSLRLASHSVPSDCKTTKISLTVGSLCSEMVVTVRLRKADASGGWDVGILRLRLRPLIAGENLAKSASLQLRLRARQVRRHSNGKSESEATDGSVRPRWGDERTHCIEAGPARLRTE